MIGWLRGRIERLAPDHLILDVGGVGYRVHVPLPTWYELERRGPGAEVSLHVHTQVREDALDLFGFWTERELALFERLIGVSGIGPRLARVALSGLPPEELVRALRAGDVARLATIPGVGKKTAERMVLELKDAMEGLAAAGPSREPTGSDEDLLAALVGLGYRPAEAEKAAAAVRAEHPGEELPQLLRLTLKRLARL